MFSDVLFKASAAAAAAAQPEAVMEKCNSGLLTLIHSVVHPHPPNPTPTPPPPSEHLHFQLHRFSLELRARTVMRCRVKFLPPEKLVFTDASFPTGQLRIIKGFGWHCLSLTRSQTVDRSEDERREVKRRKMLGGKTETETFVYESKERLHQPMSCRFRSRYRFNSLSVSSSIQILKAVAQMDTNNILTK